MKYDILVDPKDRERGLLEANNRYLNRAREAEGKLAAAEHSLQTILEIASDALAQPKSTPSFQHRVKEHLYYVCNGAFDPTSLEERRDRFGEEAMELFQALGGSREAAILIVDYVFGRPAGQPAQEFGGTATTLAGLAEYAGEDLAECAERELARTWRPEVVEKIRRKRANRHGRGPLPGDDADLITDAQVEGAR